MRLLGSSSRWKVATPTRTVPHRNLTLCDSPCSSRTGPPPTAACCDPIMITGASLGLLRWSMRADKNGRDAYAHLEASQLLEPANTISYEQVRCHPAAARTCFVRCSLSRLGVSSRVVPCFATQRTQ